MAAESCGMCLFEAMDHLWFRRIIIFSHHTLFPKSSPSSAIPSSPVETKSQESVHVQETAAAEERATMLENLVSRETWSSPTSGKKQSREGISKRSVSCKSLGDLELEELKGFMDLGFVFKKENLSRQVVSLIPGLQRMNSDGGEDEDEDGKGKIMRPYLSEAWVDSPLLLRIRISRVCNNSDKVKKHLKDWAKTVAAAIHQES